MTDTSATPIGDSLPTPTTGPIDTDHAAHAEWQPDIAALQSAKGDPSVWGVQFGELVGHTTGQWIDDGIFKEWLALYAAQVAQAANRSALFQVANTVLPTDVTGDPSLALLALRDQISQSFRKAAGL